MKVKVNTQEAHNAVKNPIGTYISERMIHHIERVCIVEQPNDPATLKITLENKDGFHEVITIFTTSANTKLLIEDFKSTIIEDKN